MLGPEGVVALVADVLAARLPGKLTELRARYAADTKALPDVGLIARNQQERVELRDYPAIEVIAGDVLRPKMVDRPQGQVIFQFPYMIRVYVRARGNSYDETDTRRKRYALAVVEALADGPLLQPSPQAWADLTSMRVSPSDVTRVTPRDARSVAAAFVELAVIVEEMTTPAAALAHANSIAVHPAVLAR